MMNRFSENKVTVGEKTIEFEVPIYKINQGREMIFVVLNYGKYKTDDPNVERNIVAFDLEGNFRWRIERPSSAPIVGGTRVQSSYVGIDPKTGDIERPIVAYDGHGLCWKVDPETGKVSDPIFTR